MRRHVCGKFEAVCNASFWKSYTRSHSAVFCYVRQFQDKVNTIHLTQGARCPNTASPDNQMLRVVGSLLHCFIRYDWKQTPPCMLRKVPIVDFSVMSSHHCGCVLCCQGQGMVCFMSTAIRSFDCRLTCQPCLIRLDDFIREMPLSGFGVLRSLHGMIVYIHATGYSSVAFHVNCMPFSCHLQPHCHPSRCVVRA